MKIPIRHSSLHNKMILFLPIVRLVKHNSELTLVTGRLNTALNWTWAFQTNLDGL